MLKITALGGLRLELDGQPITGLASRKAEALVVYLARRAGPHSRDVLADLLWDNLSTERARGNLSVLLTSLRQQLGPYLHIDRRSIAFESKQPFWMDANQFERAHHTLRKPAQSNDTAEWGTALENCLELYRGEFLHDFAIHDAPRFEAWVANEQALLNAWMVVRRHELIQHYLATGHTEHVLPHANLLIEHDPLDEKAHYAALLALFAQGQFVEATSQFERCRHVLQTELGVDPSEETIALYGHIRRELAQPQRGGEIQLERNTPTVSFASSEGSRTLRHAPTALTALIGREADLEHIVQALADEHCRLLTLVGQGGIGKTRLAIEAAQRVASLFRDGAVFVALAGLRVGQHIAATVATAIGIRLPGRRDQVLELVDGLRGRQMLLVLDNAEHLSDLSNWVQSLISEAPEIKVLVTSREPLRLQAEWQVALGGLGYPENTTGKSDLIGSLFGVRAFESFAALRLFIDRARRVCADFELDEVTLNGAMRICNLVEGLPLGIELAASWVNVISCVKIAEEIERNADFLITRAVDVNPRHRSLRAVFDHSWGLLDAQMQEALASLAVFRGGFDLDAAIAVLQQPRLKTMMLLAQLVDKSLVRRNATGRYDLHELLRQFAREKLRDWANAENEIRRRHCQHYFSWLTPFESQLAGRRQTETLHAIDIEIDNLRSAWTWAIEQRFSVGLGQAAPTLFLFLDIRNQFQEAYDLLDTAVACLVENINIDLDHINVMSRLQARLGKACERLGHFEQGMAQLKSALVLSQRTEETNDIAYALEGLGRIQDRLGNYPAAKEMLIQSLALYRESNHPIGQATALLSLASAAEGLEAYVEAQQYVRESLELRRGLGDLRGMALALNMLGLTAEMLKDYPYAISAYHEGLEFFRALGDQWGMAMIFSNLGDVTETLGDHATACKYYLDSLRHAQSIGNTPAMLNYLTKLGMQMASNGESSRAFALLTMAHRHTLTEQAFKVRASAVLNILAAKLDAFSLTKAMLRGQTMTLEEALADVLEAPDKLAKSTVR